MDITLVVAVSANGVIGRAGGLPWRLSTDLKRFKADTMGKPVVMGRLTYESLGKPLPGRLNIVVSRNADYRPEEVEVVHSLADALSLARARAKTMPDADEICVIGGGQLFEQAIGIADRLRVTHVLAEIDGDTTFPAIDPQRFVPTRSVEVPAGERDDYPTRSVVYERRRASP
ncbi:MAG TPA: dihydrofolate reductase [Tianweitania sediminis]|jgi:dihydrofolate reductase|nr:dihydrofolate reductase [Tianweitania sediminis]